MINGHALSPPLSVVAAIPACLPGAAVQVEARCEVRKNDLDGRRSLILPVGGRQDLPETAHHGLGM